jgi:hypothetical protein
MLQALLNK